MKVSQSNLIYRPEIDGLRAIAVLSVVIFHAEFLLLGKTFLTGGFLGVDIFFVISGYLITSIIVKGLNEGSFSFKNFYERRARRILPILFVVMLASIPFALLNLTPEEMKDYGNSVLYSIFFTSNFWFWGEDPYWATNSLLKPFLHTWSLSVEEQFYFIMPPLLIAIYRYGKEKMLLVLGALGLASLIFAQWASGSYPEFSFYLLPTRMWELLAGALLAVVEIKRGRESSHRLMKFLPALGLILVCVPFFYFDEKTKHPSFLTLIPIVGTMMIIWFAQKGDGITKLLSSKAFVGVGLLSYGLYLWHYPIFAFGRMMIENPTNTHKIIGILLAFLITVTTYFTIEKPFRNRAKFPKKIVVRSLATALVLIAVFNFQARSSGYSSRVPEFLNMHSEGIKNNKWYSGANADRNKRIIFTGDSHIGSLGKRAKDYFIERGFYHTHNSAPGCLFFLELHRVRVIAKSDPRNLYCTRELQKKRREFFAKAKPSYLVLGGRLPFYLTERFFDKRRSDIAYGGNKTQFQFQNKKQSLRTLAERRQAIATQYKATVKKALEWGHTVILLYPIPELSVNVPKFIMNQITRNYFINADDVLRDNTASVSYKIFKERTRSSYQVLDAIKGARIIRVYPEDIFCNTYLKGRCVGNDDKNLFYVDDNHPSPSGSKLISAEIWRKIQQFNSNAK